MLYVVHCILFLGAKDPEDRFPVFPVSGSSFTTRHAGEGPTHETYDAYPGMPIFTMENDHSAPPPPRPPQDRPAALDRRSVRGRRFGRDADPDRMPDAITKKPRFSLRRAYVPRAEALLRLHPHEAALSHASHFSDAH